MTPAPTASCRCPRSTPIISAYEETLRALVGARTGETFQLGDSVEVRLVEATPVSGGLRFEMVSSGRKGAPAGRRKRR